MTQVGKALPKSTLKLPLALSGGETASLAGYAGKWLVLYFYPAALTPGCTAQDVCCFPVCFCRSCKKFSQDSPFQRSATGCPANYKKKVLLN